MAHSHTQLERCNNSIFKSLLGIPVFYNVLIANSLIIFIGATGGTWLATHLNTSPVATPWSLGVFITIGWLVGGVLNFVVLPIAFRPLPPLGEGIKQVQARRNSLKSPLNRIASHAG